MTKQIYEDYWDITLGTSNIYGEKFNSRLKLIVNFIDENQKSEYSPAKYRKLQEVLESRSGINYASVRKNVNQYVKLGFIEPSLGSYHDDTKSFLDENNEEKKKTLFSKIVYSNSGFKKAVTEETKEESEGREINFIIKTLEKIRGIKKEDLGGFLITDISSEARDFITREELDLKVLEAKNSGFIARKHNQISYLWLILSKLDGITIDGNSIYRVDDAPEIHKSEEEVRSRDPYLHALYKNLLKEESREKMGVVQCMVEGLEYPVLIASHIKPLSICLEKKLDKEAYDPNNGLLLSRNMDVLFDLGYITFNNDGKLISSDRLHIKTREFLVRYKLDHWFITPERQVYLSYHREHIFRQN